MKEKCNMGELQKNLRHYKSIEIAGSPDVNKPEKITAAKAASGNNLMVSAAVNFKENEDLLNEEEKRDVQNSKPKVV